MNQKTAKRLRRLSKLKEATPQTQRKFYQNAKVKFKRANLWAKTQLNKYLTVTLKAA